MIPPPGTRFDLLTAASVSKVFSATNLPPLSGDHFWHLRYLPTAVQLRVATPEDTDGDALRDTWETQHFGNLDASDGAEDDFDADGFSDFFEQLCDTQPTNRFDFFPLESRDRRRGPRRTDAAYRFGHHLSG